jgi:L-aspartate oxidase
MEKTGAENVFIDVTHLPHNLVTTRFPNIYQFCLDYGLDITKEMVPVAPAAHYMMGGVKVNTWGETNIPGLFAAGETACTGVHGANRLASNSMLEVLVFSKRILERTRDSNNLLPPSKKTNDGEYHFLSERKSRKKMPEINVSNLKNIMWDKVGIIRNKEGLTETANILAVWQKGLPLTERVSYELSNMIITGHLMTEAALIREESRGAQFRTDFPETSPAWKHHIIFTNK